MIDATWHGESDIHKGFLKYGAAMDLAIKEVLAVSGATVEANAKRNFEGAHAKGKPHVGGDKPNIVTGFARRSIRMDPIRQIGFAEYMSKVGPTARYGRALELGRAGGKGYPYFGPAVDEARKEFPAIRNRIFAAHGLL